MTEAPCVRILATARYLRVALRLARYFRLAVVRPLCIILPNNVVLLQERTAAANKATLEFFAALPIVDFARRNTT